ncbi:MAG: MBL fold metallo-hydrolase [Actinomycetota bacterium]
MLFEQFYLESLGHASYLLADERTGKALVFDPRRDVDAYFELARRKGFRISYVVDSHGHNDYLSGIREVQSRQKVQALGYAQANLGYEHRAMKDGEILEFGDLGVEFMHTPGHTPEHVSLLVHDRAVGAEPALLLSGGALLVGDLARPDLLGGPDDAREAARTFCHTIQNKLLQLPDYLAVFPTHVKGSLCGGNIGSRLSTTVGYERRTNAILAKVSTASEFVQECIRLDNLPAVPPYWRRMRGQNMAGPKLLGPLGEPPALGVDEFRESAAAGSIVLDTRSPEAFASAHIPGALNVGLGPSFSTWAGTVLPPDVPVLLVLDRQDDLWEAIWQLLRIGYQLPAGWLADGMYAWRTSGEQLESLDTVNVHRLRELVGDRQVNVLDVRQPAEWAEGHVPGAHFITGAELPSRLDDVPSGAPTAVICGSGYRSSVAASLIKSKGGSPIQVFGGMMAWNASRYPTESTGG